MPESNQDRGGSGAAIDPDVIATINALRKQQVFLELQKALKISAEIAAKMAWLGDPIDEKESTNKIGGKRRRFANGFLYRYTHVDGKLSVGGVPRGGVHSLWAKAGREFGSFGYPIGMPEVNGTKTVCRFQGGTITSVAEKPRTVLFYNTALIGADVAGGTADAFIYKGRGRSAQLKAVIDIVARSQADVVVLAEMFLDDERTRLIRAVKDQFPHAAAGPDETDGLFGIGQEEDSGLLVLSRHPIEEIRATIFRSCKGEDCFANKGAVMVRVNPADGPQFCVVGTHLQADPEISEPNFGVGNGAAGKREAQLRHLDSFILADRRLDLPLVIVGDFNIDANIDDESKEGLNTFATQLPDAKDLWREYNSWLPLEKRGLGITVDKASTYRKGTPALPILNRTRGKEGRRIDLALLDQGERIIAHPIRMAVNVHDLSPNAGFDVSDHYAIRVDLGMSKVTYKLNRTVKKTQARFRGMHALRLTKGGGFGPLSDQKPDQARVTGRIIRDGQSPGDPNAPIVISGAAFGGGEPGILLGGDSRPGLDFRCSEDMSQGERHDHPDPRPTLSFAGHDDVEFVVTIKEHDDVDDDEKIGGAVLKVPKSSQLLNASKGRRYAPARMFGDRSEYVVLFDISADLEPL
ncbi:endonuclease/exonuclease/phosphatase family protein [Nocardia abscessus]|uniref:endonuclease/exonuclease/phosphatase family protein n=1 Tax=Nocardia abscessus TaxID=120957 RepID=UPI0024551BDA|nr:endonuclease/exonuclease/phosphatase family protein [Nocardia abscessus]